MRTFWWRLLFAKYSGLFILLLLLLLTNHLVANGYNAEEFPTQPVEVAFVGDFGNASSAEQAVVDLINSWTPDYVVTLGDNRYGNTTYDEVVGRYYCPYIHGAQAGPNCLSGGDAATNRFFPTAGNHEYSDGGGIASYLAYFDIPGLGVISNNNSGTELYYDFVLGPVHFFSLNSESFEGDTSAQAMWLQTNLANSTSPWQVVLMHRTPYTSASRGTNGGYLRWPYEAWGADAVIQGHDHFYERLAIGNVPYIINGAGGRSLYTFGTVDAARVASNNSDHGALKLIATDSALEFEYYTQDGVLRDTVHLPQPAAAACRTISLPAVADTWIEADHPNTNHGNATVLNFDGSPDYGALMRWDFSGLPANAVLQAAPILTLDYVNSSLNAYEIYALEQPWSAATATWNSYDGVNAWPNGAGALGDASVQIGATLGNNGKKDNITLNAQGQTTVQGWLDGTLANNGLLIADYANAIDGGDVYYHANLTLEFCDSTLMMVGGVSAETTFTPRPVLSARFIIAMVGMLVTAVVLMLKWKL